MIEVREARHTIVHRDEFAYCAHPHMAVAADGTWLVVFNRAPRRAFVLHPPEEPLFQNVLIRSRDEGKTWSAPQVVPSYDYSGTECASLTVLRDGSVFLNQWRFDWYPLDLAKRLSNQSHLSYPHQFMRGWLTSPEHEADHYAGVAPEVLAPWVRGGGRSFVHISRDHGRSFIETVEITTVPFSGGYGMRGMIECADDTIILPLCDIPNYRQVFTVMSRDGGRNWSRPSLAAAGEGHEFEEPAIIQLKSGRLLMVMRDNGTRRLHRVFSGDGGKSWSAPEMLPMEGYPPHLLLIAGGRLLMTYGWRQPDFGIRAVVSVDEGDNWDIENTISIRGGLPNKNLGYPTTIKTSEELFTVYYGEDETSTTVIMGTYWRL